MLIKLLEYYSSTQLPCNPWGIEIGTSRIAFSERSFASRITKSVPERILFQTKTITHPWSSDAFDELKGINIGSGMNSAFLSGEDNSDEIRNISGKTKFKTNNAGGILGGISSGQDIICSFAVKPTSSILNSRETISSKGKNTKISVKGRHDPCVGIRAVPIGESMMNCVLLDHYLMNKAQCS